MVMLLAGNAFGQTMVVPATQAGAPDVADLSDPETKEAVRAMVAEMSDDSVRALLIERLDAVAAANENAATGDAGIVAVAGQLFDGFLSNAINSISNANRVLVTLTKIRTALVDSVPEGFGRLLLVVLAAVVVGMIAERLVATYLKERKQALIAASSTTLWGILKILYTRLTYDVVGVLAFSVASKTVISRFIEVGSIAERVTNIALATIVGGWMAYVLCRFFFAPKRPDLRICKTTDERAATITTSFSLLAAYIVFVHNVFYLVVAIGNTYYDGFRFMAEMGFFLNISMYLAAAAVIWHNREGLTEILLENKKRVCLAIGDDTPEDLSWFALNWSKIAIALIVCKYMLVEIVVNSGAVGVYSKEAVYITFIIIFLWPGVDANVSLFVSRGVRAAKDETASAAKSRRAMQRGLLRVGRILVVGVVMYLLARLWGLNILDLANAGLGAQAAGLLVELLLIVLISYISWELVSALIGYWLAIEGGPGAEEDGEAAGEIGGVGLSRVATLLPIVRKTAQFLIVIVTFIVVLDTLGINTAPLLAGAGVVGLAIGFGAQTLVKDIVSGLFFLADDAFRVGEYIDVGGTMGTVERIALRSLRLRHHQGLVHTVPYGEIPKLTNFSRDWVIVKLRFRVPFDTDIQKVKKIFKTIGADLLQHPILGKDFLQPFKSQGVAEVDDNGMVVRGKFMAKPGQQFMIRKEVYVRVQKAFEEAGIPFARKQVMVHIPGLEKADEIDKAQIKAIGAAAAEAADPGADKA
ncbi:hypothetical protein AB833_13725 [Chromatiales bacterium (ex Bugula neritina AB1)]|nr:hypothetical protein AB833_13725 [Chromatiales bacterium (ex Bugula neritina AB1)]